ncbi:hypothetical protein DWZ54_02475 [Mitsuokella sp. AF33-22]|uniref:IS66 family insertion sequence element accessory protein TnpB n=1 Tax=Mitsuokella sp. AF33-22 TaxID=2292047 RepID=UPI000E46FD46|nr:IS66 family insertion sequence element accessory protein TnpB [Mitsuokella sp. AF33-22]RHM56728.1 hypothetical protein DWZ54_02475 [Mitsuokella sp. AF33-22]
MDAEDPHQSTLSCSAAVVRTASRGPLWDKTGFLLLCKRLEDGKYQWSDKPKDVLEISEQQLH